MTRDYPALKVGSSLMVRKYWKGVVPKIVTNVTAVPFGLGKPCTKLAVIPLPMAE